MCIRILSAVGFLVSLYALQVKTRMAKNRDYKPVCDIRENISCSKAFGSRYGVILGLPNPVYGLLFYSLMFCLSYARPHWTVYPAAAAIIFSIYLALISYVIQRNFCLVCTGIYLINLGLFICAFRSIHY